MLDLATSGGRGRGHGRARVESCGPWRWQGWIVWGEGEKGAWGRWRRLVRVSGRACCLACSGCGRTRQADGRGTKGKKHKEQRAASTCSRVKGAGVISGCVWGFPVCPLRAVANMRPFSLLRHNGTASMLCPPTRLCCTTFTPKLCHLRRTGQPGALPLALARPFCGPSELDCRRHVTKHRALWPGDA
jgi:hypothetical protein